MREYDPSWSSALRAGFNQTIAAHADIEERYISAVVERRREEAHELVARLDALDIDEARGRKRRNR